MTKRYRYLASFSVLLFVAVSASAQVAPDAGSVRQEIEKDQKQLQPKKALPEPIPNAAVATPNAAPAATVTVTAFQFKGNKIVATPELTVAVAGFLNRPIRFSELQQAAIAVADRYRRAGWIVRTYLPPQDVSNGVVTIGVIEALFGSVRVDGDPPKRISFARLESMVSSQQVARETETPLNAGKLDRSLLLINDLPGFATSANLAIGKRDRETDVMLKVTDEPLFNGELSIDNSGSRFTGEDRVIATVSGNSLFHIGDQLNTTLLHAQGINYGQVTGTAPIGYSPWRVGPHVSYLKYELVAPEFSALKINGRSTAVGLDITYPLIRARSKNLYFSFSYDNSRFNNEANSVVTTKYKISTLEVGLKGHRFDNVGGGGINNAALTFVSGKADLSDSPNKLADAASTKVNGGFNKVRYLLGRQQHLTDNLSLYVGINGQLANGNLDSSEKLYLGGATGVRAYPASEAGGDQGMLANVEGRAHLPHNFNATAFYDWGQITVNRNNNFAGAATLNSYNLQGIGMAVGWASSFHLKINASWSHRIGSNPRATNAGNDQDGTLKKNRFWLQASMSF